MKGKWFTKAKIAGISGFSAFLVAVSAAAWRISASQQPNLGDLDLDRDIDVADAVMLARLVGQDTELFITDEGFQNADVNESGSVTQDDCVGLLRYIAHLIHDFSEISVKPKVTETTATTTETTVTMTTAAETTVTTTETTVSSPVGQDGELSLDNRAFPIGRSISVLTGQEQPDETLTVKFKAGNTIFAIYGKDAANTFISIALDDEIIGYYGLCQSYTIPEGYIATEYYDTHPDGTGKLYAVLVLKEGCSVSFWDITDKDDFTFMSRMNFYITNGLRAVNGIQPLEWSGQATYLALQHSREMADYNHYGHEGIDGSTYIERLERAGIEWGYRGENIACGQSSTFELIDAWYNSPPPKHHRDWMLDPNLKYIGVGIAYNEDSDSKFYGTQDYYTLLV